MISDFAPWVALLLFAGGMTYAGVKDAMTMTISNRLVLLLAGGYAVLAPLAGFGAEQMLAGLAVAVVVLTVSFALFAFGWIGGGDAKLATVAVLWLGADQALNYVLYTSIIGAFLTLALVQLRHMPVPVMLRQFESAARPKSIPYGIALGLAALLLLPESSWLSAVL